ncbi:MAG TPA: Smr/MutS family protein [Chitinophagaceae bacterium]|nr:Smr/MutS family protein [Chitinophagaceae bacterium]
MKFSIGDPVILKTTKKEGVVKEILEDGLYLVDSEGVLFPCYAEDLDHPYLQWFLSDRLKNIQAKQNQDSTKGIATQIEANIDHLKQFQALKDGVYLSYHPQFIVDFFEESLDSFHMYIVNKTNVDIHVTLIDKDTEEALTKIKVFKHDQEFFWECSIDEFNRQSKWNLHLQWRTNDKKREDKVNTSFPLKFPVKNFFSYLPKLREDKSLHFTQDLSIDFKKIEQAQHEKKTSKKTVVSNNMKDIMSLGGFSLEEFYETEPVVDLHIQAIAPDFDKAQAASALEFQLEYAFRKLEEIQGKGIKELFLIHGIGDGILKKALHQLLEEETDLVDRFHHGYFEKYGFGATKVWLK